MEVIEFYPPHNLMLSSMFCCETDSYTQLSFSATLPELKAKAKDLKVRLPPNFITMEATYGNKKLFKGKQKLNLKESAVKSAYQKVSSTVTVSIKTFPSVNLSIVL